MKKLLIPMLALVTLSLNANADTVKPKFDVTGIWHSETWGGTASYFQEGSQVTFIYVNEGFAHYFVGRYVTPTTVKGIQHRVDRSTGCGTEMSLTLNVTSLDAMTGWVKALDSQCDLVRGQIWTGWWNTRIL